jgi:hypothetical protein
MGDVKHIAGGYRPHAYRAAGELQRIQHAHVLQLQLVDRVMKALQALVAQGFVPVGFAADLINGPSVLIEPPTLELLATRVGENKVAVRATRDKRLLYFSLDGVRVEWETMPEAA